MKFRLLSPTHHHQSFSFSTSREAAENGISMFLVMLRLLVWGLHLKIIAVKKKYRASLAILMSMTHKEPRPAGKGL